VTGRLAHRFLLGFESARAAAPLGDGQELRRYRARIVVSTICGRTPRIEPHSCGGTGVQSGFGESSITQDRGQSW
jgi:hypothetical protein